MGTATQTIALTINDRPVRADVEPRTHLGDFLRDALHLTGTHLGCEHGVCGACTVLVEGEPVRSCITFAAACGDREIRTIEGFDDDALMARLRRAFSQHHALQCGFCTPGMLVTARDIVRRFPDADEARIRLELSGNLCRCTGYMGIVAAIAAVLQENRLDPLPAATAIAAAPVTKAAPLAFVAFVAGGDIPAVTSPVRGEPAAQATPAAKAAPAAQAAPAAPAPPADRKGWTAIEDGFIVPYPLATVWDFMGDIPAVAGCLPGAELIEHDAEKVRGQIAVKFGPMKANFSGAARIERDAAAHRGAIRGAGQDNISRSRANGEVSYALSAADNAGHTRVAIKLEYMLQGPLAQFSRSGLVRDFVQRMIADFSARLAAQLAGQQGDAAALPPPAKFNAAGMVWRVIWSRLVRLFGGRGDSQ